MQFPKIRLSAFVTSYPARIHPVVLRSHTSFQRSFHSAMDTSHLPDITAQSRKRPRDSLHTLQFGTLAIRPRDPQQLIAHDLGSSSEQQATVPVLPSSPTAMATFQSTDETVSPAKRRKIAHQHSESLTDAHSAHHTPQLASLALRPRFTEETIAHISTLETSLALRPRSSEQLTVPSLRSATEPQAAASVPLPRPSWVAQAIEAQSRLPIIPKGPKSFNTLTSEIQLRVMSYLSLRDVRALRQTCREFSTTISASEDRLAQPFIEHNLDRLQAYIDAINATKMPTDVETLLACMRIWTSTRGSFSSPHVSFESWCKWFSHLSGGETKNSAQPLLFQQWAHVARVVTSLHHWIRTPRFAPANTWHSFLAEIALHPAPLNHAELLDLYNRVRSARGRRGRDRVIRGRAHELRREVYSFPGVFDGFRLTPIREAVGSDPAQSGPSLIPPYQAQMMFGLLELPALPPHDTFCYCIWRTKPLEKLIKLHCGAVVMSPLIRATVLEWVQLF